MMTRVDAAEKEATEVLHSLLSVERVEKTDKGDGESHPTHTYQATTNGSLEPNETTIEWQSPVTISQHFLTGMESNSQYSQNMEGQQVVIWESPNTLTVENPNELNTIYQSNPLASDDNDDEHIDEDVDDSKSPKKNHTNNGNKNKVKSVPKKGKKKKVENSSNGDPTKLEESAAQVKERFKRGCECQDESCFRGLNPESVYKHRLNIAELTKGEHDMYLMGVTMACLANPDTTVRQKERRRLRAQYVYQGRRVCLDAFLYLENCTHYQLKRIRKHVMTHGVAPRVHGNHGKKPHNTFSLDIYRHATEFLKQYVEQQTGETGIGNSKQPIQLPWDITRKNLHDAYKEYGQILEPGIKLMGYSTFRHFMKEQFPNVKFCKIEPKTVQAPPNQISQPPTDSGTSHPVTVQTHMKQQIQTARAEQPANIQLQKCVINNEVQQVIPLVVTPNDGNGAQHQQTFIVTPVTPVPQLIPNGNIAQNNHATNSFSYQLTNTGYVINEQGNIVTTMSNAQHTPYTFNRM